MAENLVELAQKMAQAARAGVAIEKKRLQEILVGNAGTGMRGQTGRFPFLMARKLGTVPSVPELA
jgi:hypothetical protein